MIDKMRLGTALALRGIPEADLTDGELLDAMHEAAGAEPNALCVTLADLLGSERTCRAEQDYDAMEDGIPDCRIWRCSCGEAFPYWRGCFPGYCPECGSKVVK